MRIRVRVFSLVKEGNTLDEYEDAVGYALQKRRFAIADGATESSFAKPWAQLLVDGFLRKPPSKEPFWKWVRPLQKEWFQGIKWDSLKWYAKEKAQTGAFSTLLGLELFGTRNICWRALAIGDSCMFVFRNGALLSSFPVSETREFNNVPTLVPSISSRGVPKPKLARGACRKNDLIVIATDAISQWILCSHQSRDAVLEQLLSLHTDYDFQSLVGELRSNGRIKNDDTTVMLIEVGRNAMAKFG